MKHFAFRILAPCSVFMKYKFLNIKIEVFYFFNLQDVLKTVGGAKTLHEEFCAYCRILAPPTVFMKVKKYKFWSLNSAKLIVTCSTCINVITHTAVSDSGFLVPWCSDIPVDGVRRINSLHAGYF